MNPIIHFFLNCDNNQDRGTWVTGEVAS